MIKYFVNWKTFRQTMSMKDLEEIFNAKLLTNRENEKQKNH